MRVVVPFAGDGLRDETYAAVLEHASWLPLLPEFHDVGGSDTAYCELLAMLWADGEAFAIVEQDVIPHDQVLPEFLHCPEPYCAFPYAWTVAVGPALGCTRFSAELIAQVPDALERVAARPTSWGPPGHWRQLDVALMGWILRDEEGLQPRVHTPPVEHLNDAKQLNPMFENDPVVTEYIAGTPHAWRRNARLFGVMP